MTDIPHPLIGLVGVKRSGKDTFAAGLVERGYTRVAFADPLREMVEEIDPWLITPPWQPEPTIRLLQALQIYGGWEGLKDTPYGPEARRLLQQSGQAVRRRGPGFWLNAGLAEATGALMEGAPGVVITDVRYKNEADAIQRDGGILVRIVRPDLVSTDTHPSETELADYPTDFTIRNSGTADELVALARDLRF
ncbi:hypothetical protein [Promicromonospora kroppenstedtii]|uniref:deoxynucleotide monophosphate kinase family protein n=1 Tax=Promicromonospora kroppenstedtii TaxID=440482 RepID=UPI0004BC0E12|nr:hypothetical protein [Promicromonospora kroppenstedtii]